MAHVKVNVGADGSGFNAVMDKVEHRVSHLSGHLNSELKSNLASFFGGAAIEAAIHNMVEFSVEIEHASKRLGIATDRIQELRATARHAGKDLDFFDGVFRNIEKSAAQAIGGDTKKAGIFAKLGISDDTLKHANKADLLQAIMKGTEGKDRTQAEQLLAGVAGAKNGSALLGMRPDLVHPEDMNVNKVSNEDIQALAEAHLAWEDIVDTLRTGLIPALVTTVQAVMDFGHNLMQGFKVAFAYVEGLLAHIKDFSVSGGLKSLVGANDKATTGVLSNAWSVITGKESLKEGFNNVWDTFADSGKDVLTGFFGDDAVKAAEDAATTMGQVTDEEDTARDDRRKKRLEEWKKEQAELAGKVDRAAAPTKAAKDDNKPLLDAQLKASNEFVKIGGFMGVDATYRLERLGQATNDLLRQIVKNTTPAPDTSSNEDYVPGD